MSASATRPAFRFFVSLLIAAPLLVEHSTASLAHGAERGFVMLLPTGHFVLGGALAVAASFIIVLTVPDRAFERIVSMRLKLGSIPGMIAAYASTLSAIFLAIIILLGFNGSRDPLANPLPLTIWTVWWVGIVLLHAIAGHLWFYLNPFTGPYAILDLATGGRLSHRPVLAFPRPINYAPAFVLFLLFAWYQLVLPAPDDPGWLAVAVVVYSIFTFGAVCVFGPQKWLGENDPFAVFFRLVSAVAPIHPARQDRVERKTEVYLLFPGAGLADQAALPPWGVLFVLLTLSSVSFDGFSNTFFWLALGGINPLDFPGRTAVMTFNTFGLIGFFAALAAIFTMSLSLGWILAERPGKLLSLVGRMVLSLIPISIAFHFAHYLTDLLVNGQYAVLAINDPLQAGWNILGLENYHVTTSFLNTASGSQAIYFIQVLSIVAGHIVSVAVAHFLLLKSNIPRRRLSAIESPLAILMIGYTAFGLWLLSTPSIG